MDNRAPTERRQDWLTIFFVAVVTFFVTWIIITMTTWSLVTRWPSLSWHLAYLRHIVFDFSHLRTPHHLQTYWAKIELHNQQLHFLLHLLLPIPIASLIAISCGRKCYVPGGYDLLKHVSGPQLFQFDAAIAHANNRSTEETPKNSPPGLFIHPSIRLSKARGAGNKLVVGQQGSGKTIFITPLINQVMEWDHAFAFIYDEKREFTSLFFNRDTCWSIAPWEDGTSPWDIQRDANTAERAQLIAEILIPDSSEPLWSVAARLIFAGMIQVLNKSKNKWGWRELASMIVLDERQLSQLLGEHYKAAQRLVKEDNKTSFSFLVQIQGQLGWVATLAKAWPKAYENGFSVKRWLSEKNTVKRFVFVQANKQFKNIGAPLASTLITLLTTEILSKENSSTRDLYIFLDELANLAKTAALFEWMSLGRSKGCRMVAGTQSIASIRAIYGNDLTDSMLNMFSVIVCTRVGATGDTARYMAEAFGERQIERPSYTTNAQGQITTQWHPEKLPLVNPSDLVQLPQPGPNGAEGYLMVPGWNAVYRLRWPVPTFPVIAPKYQPATWLAQEAINQPPHKSATLSRRELLQKQRTGKC